MKSGRTLGGHSASRALTRESVEEVVLGVGAFVEVLAAVAAALLLRGMPRRAAEAATLRVTTVADRAVT